MSLREYELSEVPSISTGVIMLRIKLIAEILSSAQG